jgi:DNA-binding NarL/FixJ family response regulator
VNRRPGHDGERKLVSAGDGAFAPWHDVANLGSLPEEHVLVVDDCTLFRDNLVAVLSVNGFPTPRGAWDLPSLVAALEDGEIRVVLVNMKSRGSTLLLSAAMDMNPDLRVIAIGASEADETDILACAEAGVAGYHMRWDSLSALIILIQDVAAGISSCPPVVSAMLLRRLSTLAAQSKTADRELVLTAREIQILRMIEVGRSNREIADELDIAIHTVKNHVHNVLTKLGVGSRAEAAALSRTIAVDPKQIRAN